MIEYGIRDLFLHAAGFLDVFLGVFVLSKNIKSARNLAFFILALSVAAWSFAVDYFLLTQNIELAYFFIFMVAMSIMFIAISLYHVVLSFIYEDLRVYFKKLILFYCINSLVLIGCFIPNFYIKNIIFHSWGKENVLGIGYYLIYAAFAAFVVYSFYILISSYIKDHVKNKIQLQYLIYSTIFAFAFGSWFNWVLVLFGNYRYIWVGPLSSFILVAVTAFSILKQNLLDIRVIIGRSAAYGIVAVLLVASFFALNALKMPVLISMVTNSALALIWAWAANKLRELIQTPIDKWISWYKPDDLLNSIVKELGLVTEREGALKIIAAQLQNTIKIKKVNILLGKKPALPAGRDNSPIPCEYTLLEKGAGYLKPLRSDHPLIANLKEAVNYNKLTPEIRESIKEFGFLKDGLYLPLFSTEGLEGVIILSQKVSEDPYDKKDLTFFDTLIIQTKAFLDRIRPYEELERDFQASKKKLYDTERILARSEKIASMANLIQEYNHEVKTPLSIIRGETGILAKETRDMDYLKWFRDLVFEQVDRADDIVESTLRLSEGRARKEVDLNLNEVIEKALKNYPLSGIKIIKELNPLPFIRGDLEDLQMVFINIFKNAAEAMTEIETAGRRILKIITYSRIEDNEPVVYAEISDTGAGIPQENMEKIFEPFFSTHVTKGRGLGLSIVFRIIREHLGKIEVKSNVGAGSTFKIQLRANKQ